MILVLIMEFAFVIRLWPSDFWHLNRVIHLCNCLPPGLNDVVTVKDFKLFMDSPDLGIFFAW